ncbi:MAG: hypothetical protein ABMA15_08995 [Vicinamibacterales bacterium]
MTNPRLAAIGISALVVGTLAASCSKGTTITPSCTPVALTSLTLSPSSVAVGTSVQGTVSLSCPASSGGATVTLSSSDASATVPASVIVASGNSSAPFTVTTVSAGTPTISAGLSGATVTQVLTITGGTTTTVSLANMTLASSSVVGGNSVTGTVTLSAAAPSGGTVVNLSSSDASVGTVPASVTVLAGSTTATFSVGTRAVGGTINIVISAVLSGVTRTANLAVTQVVATLTARFTVASLVNAAVNTCQLSNDGSSLSCRFDASTSTSPNGFREYRWTWQLPTRSATATVASSTLDNPTTNGCNLFNDLSSQVKASGNPISMTVRLTAVDTTGTVSAEATNTNVQILPTKNACGFNF